MIARYVSLTFAILHLGECAKILAIVPVPSYSHHQLFNPIWKELSLRGHQVTTLTAFPMKDPQLTNLTEIDLSSSEQIWREGMTEIIKHRQSLLSYHSITNILFHILEEQLNHPDVQALINGDGVHFDLVIAEHYLTTMFAFSYKFNCPLIGVWSMDLPNFKHRVVGNPYNPVVYPDYFLPFEVPMTTKERIASITFSLATYIYSKFVDKWEQDIIYKYFGNNYPSVEDLSRNLSLVFINSHPALNTIRPKAPSVIEIGGAIHYSPPRPLPKDLEKILNNSNGFIYFSLGTNVRSADMSDATKTAIMEVFAELPYIVLWKHDLDDVPNKTSNVFTSKWWPQRDLFNHPKIKLFITHGGIQSINEAIFAHVPLLGVPYFADQPANVQKMVTRGCGLFVDIENLDKEHFKRTILEVINNPRYKKKVEELANLATDQPTTILERVVWWTEYVLRHKGAKHLRSPSLDIPLYQYFLLDIIAATLLILIIIFCVVYYFVTGIVHFRVFKTKSKSE
ncbi:hypothetical protein RI129_010847 [Pyrocoelia pectoralis]|uniref:UDP-glucuronosyltransferase n=1 Tax=Pyrocoelia pectoralis TaxID=417401 RepID=A0AAN7V7Q9_9COLE